ncbi:MAG: NAD(P)H-dependent oxidoreductase [Clostridia bacterium]|nr:NAD(P)H-dependent oxidoreductase [Clostridia bacterium]
MKFLIINGSPKGKNSITLQSLNYLEKLHSEHEFRHLHAGQMIRALEADFSKAEEALSWADAIIFSYPVYTFIAPAQLHRFVELLFERGVDIRGKFATSISTSKHFYDVTAHKYIEENSLDLGLKYVKGLSADMDDLTKPEGRAELESFFDYFIWCISTDTHEVASDSPSTYRSVPATLPESAENAEKSGDVVIITDCKDEQSNLYAMIERFRAVFQRKTRIFNIADFPFQGGCLGCFNCAVSGKCIYKDNFDTTLRESIQTADAIVYAFDIKYHSFGSRMKMYNDRNFCNGHRTVTVGMPVGYLLSGDYEREENLRMIVEGRADVGHNFLAGVATDEHDTDLAIDKMAEKLTYALDHKYVQPQTFLGIGGMKIFRDLIYLMRGMMRADHKFYKAGGYYKDFPQRQWPKSLAMYLVGFMIGNEKLKKKIGNKMTEGMLMPYVKVLSDLDKKG